MWRARGSDIDGHGPPNGSVIIWRVARIKTKYISSHLICHNIYSRTWNMPTKKLLFTLTGFTFSSPFPRSLPFSRSVHGTGNINRRVRTGTCILIDDGAACCNRIQFNNNYTRLGYFWSSESSRTLKLTKLIAAFDIKWCWQYFFSVINNVRHLMLRFAYREFEIFKRSPIKLKPI